MPSAFLNKDFLKLAELYDQSDVDNVRRGTKSNNFNLRFLRSIIFIRFLNFLFSFDFRLFSAGSFFISSNFLRSVFYYEANKISD